MSDLEKFLSEYRHDGKWELTEEQKDYVRDCVDGDSHVACFSDAGSGKSITLEALKHYLGNRLVISATTGIANSILFNNRGGDGTMHRVFSLPLGMHKQTDVSKVKKYCTGLFASSDLVTHVMVEEAGMMNPDQLELIRLRLERFNKPIRGKRKQRKIKLILSGDLLQLLPVLKDQDKGFLQRKYGSHFLFESTPFKSMNFNVHTFTKVLRTKDKILKSCLDVLRFGQEDRYEGCLKWLNKRYVRNIPEGLPFITTTNKKVDEANEKALAANPNPPFKYTAKVTGDFNMNECPVDKHLVLKKDLPVLCLINHEDGDFSNGSFGYVNECLDDGVFVDFPATNETHFVPLFEFEQRESFISEENLEDGTKKEILDSKVVGRAVAVPLKIAAARSIFRVQGATIDVPTVLDLGYYGFDMNEDIDWGVNKTYTGISRFTSPDLIYLKHPLFHNTSSRKTHIKPHRKAINWLKEVVK